MALAAALLHEPELLFLDEPTGASIRSGRRMFWDLIYELAADRGMTVLVTTHYMDEAEQCDRLAFILEGDLIADGSPLELKSHLAGRLFEVEVDTGCLRGAGGPAQRTRSSRTCISPDATCVPCSDRGSEDGSHAPRSTRWAGPNSAEPSLEDVFVSLARKRGPGAKEAA